MFESLLAIPFLDYFRIPYQIVSSERPAWLEDHGERHPLRSCGALIHSDPGASQRALRWPIFDSAHSPFTSLAYAGRYRLGSIPLHGQLLPDSICGPWLQETGSRWRQVRPIWDERGFRIASEWQNDDGGIFLPYDPADAIHNFWSEDYRDHSASTLGALVERVVIPTYYRVRPRVPRSMQIQLRRLFSHLQARRTFPAWPVETALHEFYDLLFRHVANLAREPVPWLSCWPDGHSWALVLTHDVETVDGYRDMSILQDVEEGLGYRSSWNFVPKRYEVEDSVVARLRRGGFEVGVHGLFHDGRDLESLSMLSRRLPVIREYASRWAAVGFRSPATQRVWGWMPLLGFDYDSSYPDTDPFEPQAGGCCTWLPYFNQDMVELPITLPQDHTLFVILGKTDGSLWMEKAEYLRRSGGMALLITHPDYLSEKPLLPAYQALLQRFASDSTAWKALPCEVSAWWQRRAASRIELTAGGWRIVGPAADEARVTYALPG